MPSSSWDERFQELVDFQHHHGHCDVSDLTTKKAPPPAAALGCWVVFQRSLYRKKRLSKDKIQRLESIGFDWNLGISPNNSSSSSSTGSKKTPTTSSTTTPAKPTKNVAILFEPSKKENASSATTPASTLSTKRGKTRMNQHQEELESVDRSSVNDDDDDDSKSNSLASSSLTSPHRIKQEQAWEDKFTRLLEFQKEFGHCLVPQGYAPDKPLGTWVNWQRMQYKYGKIRPDRVQRLEKVGFVWKQGHQPNNVVVVKKTPKNANGGRKVSTTDPVPSNSLPPPSPSSSNATSTTTPVKRKRGRPRKHPIGAPTAAQKNGNSNNSVQSNGNGANTTTKAALQEKDSNVKTENEDDEIVFRKGSRVSVYWSDDEEYYHGWVSKTRQKKKQLFVEYDDGDAGWVDLDLDQVKACQVAAHKKQPQQQQSPEQRKNRKHKKKKRRKENNNRSQSPVMDDDDVHDENDDFQVGSRIAVYWSDDDEFYTGDVSKRKGSRVFVDYDDGDQEWIDLTVIRVKSANGETVNNKNSNVASHHHPTAAAATSTTSTNNNSEKLKLQVGRKIAVYWSDDDDYYNGVISKIKSRSQNEVFVTYDDGEEEWIDLHTTKIKRATANSKKKKKKRSHKKAAEPAANQPAPATTITPPTKEAVVVKPGLRVSVWWPAEEKFFPALVQSIKEHGKSNKPHYLVYDDGDMEWTNLTFRKWKTA